MCVLNCYCGGVPEPSRKVVSKGHAGTSNIGASHPWLQPEYSPCAGIGK
jgi:hypothetical protein